MLIWKKATMAAEIQNTLVRSTPVRNTNRSTRLAKTSAPMAPSV